MCSSDLLDNKAPAAAKRLTEALEEHRAQDEQRVSAASEPSVDARQ